MPSSRPYLFLVLKFSLTISDPNVNTPVGEPSYILPRHLNSSMMAKHREQFIFKHDDQAWGVIYIQA